MTTPAIFYKDFRIGLRRLLIAPVSLLLMYVGIKLVWEGLYGALVPEIDLGHGAVLMLACMNCFIAIIIGAQVSAEEKHAGTDAFLARLPISRWHLYCEKHVAALGCLGLLYVATLVFFSFLDLESLWEHETRIGTIESNFFIIIFSSYAFAILCSRITEQSIAILLLSFCAECLLWLAIGVTASVDEVDWYALRISVLFSVLVFVVPAVLVWRQWQLPLHPRLWGTQRRTTLVRGLIWKSFAENGLLHAMCFLLSLATLLLTLTSTESIRAGDSLIGAFIFVMAGLLLAALGTNAYATSERKGLHCITYYHPVSRGLLFATKLLPAVPSILVVSVALALAVEEHIPAISVLVASLLLYLMAVQMCLTYQSGTLVVVLAAILGVGVVVGVTVAWMVPMDNALIFDGFTPVHDPLLVGLIPMVFMAFGSLLTSWRLATNRRFLASSDSYRQCYSLACFLIAGAVTWALVWAISEAVVL